jgi:hypothetical protein
MLQRVPVLGRSRRRDRGDRAGRGDRRRVVGDGSPVSKIRPGTANRQRRADPSERAPDTRTDGTGLVIKLRLGGDTLELTGVPPAELRRLTGQWLDSHTAGIPADERD